MTKEYYQEQLTELTERIKLAKDNDNEALARIILGTIDIITALINEQIELLIMSKI